MDLLAGPFLACALLLVAAGALKARWPATTVLGLRSVGIRLPTVAVRAGGVAESLLGAAAILVGGRGLALAVAASYAAFAAFVAFALKRGGVLSSCGCFGKPDTPPTVTHLAVNIGATAIGFGAAVRPVSGLADLLGGQPLGGGPLLLLVGLSCWLGYLLLAVLPTVRPAWRQSRART